LSVASTGSTAKRQFPNCSFGAANPNQLGDLCKDDPKSADAERLAPRCEIILFEDTLALRAAKNFAV
jgi:hypothetical protein